MQLSLSTCADAAIDIISEAGEIAKYWYEKASYRVDTKGDGSPVTQADREIELFVRKELADRFPDDDKEIKHGAQLIVCESQMAQFVYLGQFGDLPGLAKLLERLGVEEESPGSAASAVEFAMDGLHLSKRLNKDEAGRVGAYRYEGFEPSR